MPKKNKQGKTAKEIRQISERLYESKRANQQRPQDATSKGIVLEKKEIDEIVGRLYEKDPNGKRKELSEKAYAAKENDRPGGMGWQKKNKKDVEDLTERLFIPNYNNRNVRTDAPKNSGNTVTKSEMDEIIERLFISNYSNKNIENNKSFYDQILNKKKANEKEIKKEELDEMVGRLSRMTRVPAECNTDMRGRETYKKTGIFGTYALTQGDKIF